MLHWLVSHWWLVLPLWPLPGWLTRHPRRDTRRGGYVKPPASPVTSRVAEYTLHRTPISEVSTSSLGALGDRLVADVTQLQRRAASKRGVLGCCGDVTEDPGVSGQRQGSVV